MYILPLPGHYDSGAASSSSSTNMISTLKHRVSTFARSIVSRKKVQEAASTPRDLRRMSIGSHSSSQTCSTDATLVDDPDRVPVALFRSSRRLSGQVERLPSVQLESPSSAPPGPRPSVQLEYRLSLAEMRAQASSPPPPPSSFVPPTERPLARTERRLTLAEMRASWSGPPSSYVPPRPAHPLSHPRSFEMQARPRSLHGPSSFDISYSSCDPRRSSVSLSLSSPATIQASTSSNISASASGTVPANTMRRQLSISFADETSLIQRGEDAQRRRSSARASSMRAAGHTRSATSELSRATSVIRRATSEPAVIALSEPAAIALSEPAVVSPQTTAVAAPHSSAVAASQASAVPSIKRTRTRKFFIPRLKSWSGKKTFSSVDDNRSAMSGGKTSFMKRQSTITPGYVAAVGMVVHVS